MFSGVLSIWICLVYLLLCPSAALELRSMGPLAASTRKGGNPTYFTKLLGVIFGLSFFYIHTFLPTPSTVLRVKETLGTVQTTTESMSGWHQVVTKPQPSGPNSAPSRERLPRRHENQQGVWPRPEQASQLP